MPAAHGTLPVMTVLVLGFGPFGSIVDNPASALARSVAGRTLRDGAVSIVGVEMPVTYETVPSFTLDWIERCRPVFTLGIGVAAGRAHAAVERVGRNRIATNRPDHAGRVEPAEPGGPDERVAAGVEALAAALGVPVSDDAGDYVCNAWLYRMLATGEASAFLHIPLDGLDPEQLVAGLDRYVRASGLA